MVTWWLLGLLALLGLYAIFSTGLIPGVALLALALVAAALLITRDPETLPVDPNPTSSFRIVALGDSYISGEGAPRYFPGTDEPGRNLCHRAATAYPRLVAAELGVGLSFVACSGATTPDVTGVDAAGARVPGQYPRSGAGVLGARPQVAVLRDIARPDVVLISIGGNDAGFAEIGTGCATPGLPDCLRSASFWLRRLDTVVYPALVRTYTAVRRAAEGAPVFALTYPDPIGPDFCSDLAGLRPAEMAFLRDVFVGRLNEIVESAAAVARVRVIDLTHALDGYRFCEKPLGKTAVNFIELERSRGAAIDLSNLGSIAHGTLHPNRLGHELIESVVAPVMRALRAGRLEPLAPVPPASERPPKFVPEEIRVPSGPRPFPRGTDCAGTEIAVLSPVSAAPDLESVSLTGVQPRSTVCFRTYRAEWESTRADSTGNVRVPVDVSRAGVGSINEILAEQPGGIWKEIVVSRLGAADEGQAPGS